MRTVESVSRAPSIVPGARTCTFSSGDLHQILNIVRTVHRKGAAKWLQGVTKRSPRTVKYWLADEYAPRGGDALAIARALRAELGEYLRQLQQFEFDLR